MASAFDRLAQQLAGKKGVQDPRALAYSIGAKKYGAKTMGQAAAKGVPAASIKKKRRYP